MLLLKEQSIEPSASAFFLYDKNYYFLWSKMLGFFVVLFFGLRSRCDPGTIIEKVLHCLGDCSSSDHAAICLFHIKEKK
jgi:hypothetical protein